MLRKGIGRDRQAEPRVHVRGRVPPPGQARLPVPSAHDMAAAQLLAARSLLLAGQAGLCSNPKVRHSLLNTRCAAHRHPLLLGTDSQI